MNLRLSALIQDFYLWKGDFLRPTETLFLIMWLNYTETIEGAFVPQQQNTRVNGALHSCLESVKHMWWSADVHVLVGAEREVSGSLHAGRCVRLMDGSSGEIQQVSRLEEQQQIQAQECMHRSQHLVSSSVSNLQDEVVCRGPDAVLGLQAVLAGQRNGGLVKPPVFLSLQLKDQHLSKTHEGQSRGQTGSQCSGETVLSLSDLILCFWKTVICDIVWCWISKVLKQNWHVIF